MTKHATATEHDPRWARVLARDPAADGQFYYSVATTGVYCRPSCPSRRANPRNVRFHPDVAACEAAGFRPCRRCRPDQASPDALLLEKVTRVCQLVDAADTPMSLAEMSRAAGLSRYHFHRVFKSATGVTPGRYAAAHRAAKMRNALTTSETVTAAIYDAGFNSSGRFYESAGDVLGMTPTKFRAGGPDTDIRFAVAECSLGTILVACSAKGVCAISLGDAPEPLVRELQDLFPAARLIDADAAFETLVAKVVALAERPSAPLGLPLDIRGTAFQQKVWQALSQIPPGTKESYSQIAERIGAPRAVRAVAGACGANRLAIAIPCHRVVRNDGSLSGYRWGVQRKQALLDKEVAAETLVSDKAW